MTRPPVADRGDGLHIWGVATNILNKQSRTADNGYSILGVGWGLTTPNSKEIFMLRNVTQGLELEGSCEPLGSHEKREIS
jgi:hypothetical protein